MRKLQLSVLLLAMASSAVFAQGRAPIEVSAHAPTSKVRLDDVLRVQVIVRNVEEQRSVVLRGQPGFSEAGGVRLDFTDHRGARTPLPATRGRLSLDEARSGNRALVLKPGWGVGVYRELPVREVFQRAGRYTLRATYESPSPTSNNPSVDRRHIEGAQAESMQLAIEVTE